MKTKLLWACAAILLLFLLLVIRGLVEPYTLDDEEETAIIPNLPTAWEGKIIAQVSDFQVGMWWDNLDTIVQSVDKLIVEQPAIVLITGDFIYHALPEPETQIKQVIELIRPLTEANIPTYAVLGNHDYGMKNPKMPPKTELAAQLKQTLENIGIRVLTNEAVKLPLENQHSDLYLVGIGSNWANNDKINQALAHLADNSPRLIMMHNPESFKAFPDYTAPFAVAGHTHGGQIRLPYLSQWSWLALVKEGRVFADGWSEEGYGEEGNKLYVNRGIGFSELPLRINCVPEVTFFTLKSSDN